MPHRESGTSTAENRESDTSDSTGAVADSTTTRRSVVKAAGGSLVALSLAGCQDDGRSGGTDGGGGEPLTLGVITSLSGPYSFIGERELRGAEFGVKHAMEKGDIDRDVNIVDADSETDPGTAGQRVRSMLQDDVDLLFGSASSSVALSVQDVAQREGVHYTCSGGSLKISRSCTTQTFNFSDSARLQSEASLGYVLDEGMGESVYQITSDYTWGESSRAYERDHLMPRYDVEDLGNASVPLGESDYSSVIIQAKESGADIVDFNTAHHDQVTSLRQAAEFGLLDEAICVWPASTLLIPESVDQEIVSHENAYFGSLWYWEVDSPGNDEFVEPYYEEYDRRPDPYAMVGYASVRTMLSAVNEVGSTDPEEVAGVMEDKEIVPQMWGNGERYRGCDHRIVPPSITLQGRPPGEVTDGNYFKPVNTIDNPEEFMLPCDEAGCN